MMKNYLSIKEAAEKWGVSERRINQYCSEGRIPGAQKFGKSWAIPAEANKPGDPRKAPHETASISESTKQNAVLKNANLMPLMNTDFAPGHCLEAVKAMDEGVQRDIALAEYYYFSGQAEKAAKVAEEYLVSPDIGARLSACLIYAYANLSIGQISKAKFALGELNASLAATEKQRPELRAASAFVSLTGAVLLHLPLPDKMLEVESMLPMLPPGLRAFAMYV